ncbi:MAG TPA: Fur family transcriptional regulator [Egibacteraceae bacterium]|nr:Fur family transcriptional regulator [Egibacteraceae bacterium]
MEATGRSLEPGVPAQGGTISDLLQRLRARGWRVTAQRRVVAEVLQREGAHAHLTADEVHARARRILPEISRATVYNTLNELVRLDEVLEVTSGAGPKRYDPDAARDHHHIVCVGCGQLRDVHPVGHESLRLPPAQRHGFELVDVAIVFRGRCPACRES